MYVRPTKKLCFLTALVVAFAVVSVFYISFALAQELGAHAGRHVHIQIEGVTQ